jgi:hypothetical protein
MRRIYLLPLGIILVLAIVVIFAYPAIASQITSKTTTSFVTGNHAASGRVGNTLVTPDGLEVTLVAVEHHGTQVLFHLRVHNEQGHQAYLWNADANHGFVFYNQATGTFDRIATVPTQADLATHPALAHTLGGQASADGWIAATQLSPSPYTSTLYYYYRAIHTVGCPKPSTPSSPIDKSKCWPATLYSTVHWDF